MSLAHFREYATVHPFSWNSRLLKVQKHDNKQNFDYKELVGECKYNLISLLRPNADLYDVSHRKKNNNTAIDLSPIVHVWECHFHDSVFHFLPVWRSDSILLGL